tara:strand:- start:484 stop:1251 length:768 start_codon:yes stop_codon:yes gene_type:complete
MVKAVNRGKKYNKETDQCWVRYNNQGSKYVVCGEKSEKSKGPKGPPFAHITKPITSAEFEAQHGPYADLSPGQKAEYHALATRRARWEERQAMLQGASYLQQYKQIKAQERDKWKEMKEQHKQEHAKKKKEKKEKILKGEVKVKETKFKPPKVILNNKKLSQTNENFKTITDPASNPEHIKSAFMGLPVSLRNDLRKVVVDTPSLKKYIPIAEVVINLANTYGGIDKASARQYTQIDKLMDKYKAKKVKKKKKDN